MNISAMIIPELDEQETESKDGFTDLFIEEYIHTQKARIQTRKLIEEMLFFASCQVASASLALILFQYAVTLVFTTWLCLFVAWIPSLSNLTEVHFQKLEDGWTLKIMNRPLTTLIKFVSSVGIVTSIIYSIATDLNETAEQIAATYAEIDRYEQPRLEQFLPPYFFPVLLMSVGIVLLVGHFKSRRPF